MGDSNAADATRSDEPERNGSYAERRDPTGVPHLDEVLGGGLPRGSLVLVMGLPGSGKTTLASQIVFTAARSGKRALILTALSESTSKLLEHLRAFSFFDLALIGGPVQFLSLQGVLALGLEAACDAIVTEVRRVKADVVLLDGFRGLRTVDSDPLAAREFLYMLGTTLATLGCTTIITTETDPRDPNFFPESTTADVILGLHYALIGVRQHRGLEVVKARTAAPLPGLHTLTLSADGVSVYPQLEERVAAAALGGDAQTQGAARATGERALPAPPGPAQRARFDLPVLDMMLSGGLPRSTCTLLAGSPGSGKTLLALCYALAGVRAEEATVILGFRESLEQLRLAASSFSMGPELDRALRPGGGLTFSEVPPIKVNVDILADRLLMELDRTHAQRLVIDSISELERAILHGPDPQRLDDYFAALLAAMRARRVTGLLVKETEKSPEVTFDVAFGGLSGLAENVLLLQQVPYGGALHRILSVVKLRFSNHDTALREFRISAPEGFHLLEAPAGGGVVAGISREHDARAAGSPQTAARVSRGRHANSPRSPDDERE
ncbi:MAG: RAD55 family ATPase [Ktedonobacterales bacterium]